ncbi:MAG TPA: shikimate dehydrogenase [Bacteroidia bacterium]|jgi:shikimate dehydrogenase|nr:shikimate dehydrogenase [Bacteroidia bacterium]
MRRFGLIGYPLSHSFSKKYFTEKFEAIGLKDCGYELYPLPEITGITNLLHTVPELLGLNVTIPYKESVLPFIHHLDETARAVGAVNTIRISHEKNIPVLTGYNTDIYGFRQSIKPFLESHHERALILGTGGASKAVAFVLKQIGVDVYFVTRRQEAGGGKQEKMFAYEELNEHVMRNFPLIINTTPLGTYPNVDQAPDIPYSLLTNKHFLYDLTYNPEVTRFMAEGLKRGAQVLNGLSMLQQQAEKAWEIWNS